MFKFAFSSDASENQTNGADEETALEWFECKEILPAPIIFMNDVKVNTVECDELKINYVSNEDVVRALKKTDSDENSILSAEHGHSDLISAVYEGGLKIWECTFDLLNFIKLEEIDLSNKKVLDLGCGAGIIGIYSCLRGARVVFQDYNVEVIRSVTIPNVSVNSIDYDQCKFYSGDWKSFLDLEKKLVGLNNKFDYIFTSETIYNVNNYRKIVDIFKLLLKKTGIIYLAAKCHYFGVGGSIKQFEDALKMEDTFNYSTCWICSQGVKRTIIKITLK